MSLLLTLAVLPCGLHAPAAAGPSFPGQADERAAQLLAQIRARGNGVAVEVLEELGGLGTREALEGLVKGTALMKSKLKVFSAHRAFRHFAAEPELARDAAAFLAERTEHSNVGFARNAAFWLGALMPHAVDQLAGVVEEGEDADCRALALMRLVDSGMALDEGRLARWARARDELVRYEALRAQTARLEDPAERAERVARLERSSDTVDRLVAAQLLADLGTDGAARRLCALLSDDQPRVRRKALDCLEQVPAREAVPELIEVLAATGEPDDARTVAARLGGISGVRLGTDVARWRAWWEAEAATFEPPRKRAAVEADDDAPTRARFYGLPVDSQRVVFAVDASNSMQRAMPRTSGESRIDVAKEQLRQVIGSLEAETRFDLVHFGGGAAAWQGELTPVGRGTLRRALAFVDEMELSFGTDVYGGLHQAFRDPEVDTVLFLTDGDPYLGAVDDRPGLRRVVRQWNATRHVKVHCIAVGQERAWLRKLAEESGGRYVCLE
jgi:HEAT repeat protein